MNDRCSPDTARRLKDQGFPQPVPEPGQVWTKKDICVIIIRNLKGHTNVAFENGTHVFRDNLEGACFCPTAPDILRELGYEYTLHHEDIYFCIYEPDGPELKIYENPNPAEACAEAWEAKQKQG